MTDRLYYTDSYLKDFDASVVERVDDGRLVYLDRTAFYPTSGGQPFDTGRLGGIKVIDVVDEGERIAHVLAGPLPEGSTVGQVDWPRRFDHMQQHTGQHLLSAVLADLFGYQTIGVHFGQETSTLDLETGKLTQDQVDRSEERANEIVVENRAVDVTFEEAGSAAGLRKPSDRLGTLRMITIRRHRPQRVWRDSRSSHRRDRPHRHPESRTGAQGDAARVSLRWTRRPPIPGRPHALDSTCSRVLLGRRGPTPADRRTPPGSGARSYATRASRWRVCGVWPRHSLPCRWQSSSEA